ncbi:energy transducer TonB [Paraglaciecola sp. L3A3]|uniref:energy transducer TonB n=1 Tax=Paraglaciecola sp. L3A3 TaxID=2686358 RepID=UPI00131D00C7|nr:energy transducer TonB [Paraglaciecola sp. L3A3]
MKKIVLTTIFLSVSWGSNANMFKAHEALSAKNYKEAHIELLESASIGEPEAQFNLGVLNLKGLIGDVDYKKAMAWFYLASEYDYPQAFDLSSQIFQKLSKSDQDHAASIAEELAAKYGKKVVTEKYFPNILTTEIDEQKNEKRAKMLKRGKLHITTDNKARAHNQSVLNSAIRNYTSGSNRSGLSNLNKTMVHGNSGRVEVIFDARADGKVQDTEVIFSWPTGRFEKSFVAAIDNSQLKAAERDGKLVEQYGMFKHVNIYYEGVRNLKKNYPHLYNTLLSMRRLAKDSVSAKYQYACFLRAYNDLFDDQQLEAFQPVLLAAAEEGHSQAQYDYGMYLLYKNDEVDAGIAWILKAAKYGLLEAEYRLGDILYQSPSPYLEQDLVKAKYWLEKSAKNNHLKARQKLVALSFANNSVDKQLATQAIDWLEDIEDENQATPHTYYLLAKAYHFIGDKPQALEYVDEAIAEASNLEWNTEDWTNYRKQLKG